MQYRLTAAMASGVLLVQSFLAGSDALAFGKDTHEAVTRFAVSKGFPAPDMEIPCPDEVHLPAFFAFLHQTLASLSDEALRERFLVRWPTPEAFDSFEVKGLFDLTRNPGFAVEGFDTVSCPGPASFVEIAANESVRPDMDGRNKERLACDAGHRPIVGAAGPFPEDPAVLDMGGLSGLASQAHAHYALAREGLTDDPWTLLIDPGSFAVASAVEDGPITLGPQMAREHFLLALLAGTWDGPTAERLTLSYLGAALHYTQDASDPLHTTQVGNVVVVADAFAAHCLWATIRLGGYLGDLKGLKDTIADLLSNYHLWIEALWDKRSRARIRLDEQDEFDFEDEDPEAILEWALDYPAWASDQVRPWARDLFRYASETATPDIKVLWTKLEDGRFDPDDYTQKHRYAGDIQEIGHQSRLVAARASLALVRAYVTLLPWAATEEGREFLATKLLKERMKALTDREARLAKWRAQNPDGLAPGSRTVKYWWFPLVLLALLAPGFMPVLVGITVAIAVTTAERRKARLAATRVGSTTPSPS